MTYPYDFEVDCEVTFISSAVVEEAYGGRDRMSLLACALLLADAEEKIEDGWTWLAGVIGELICRNIAEHYHP